MRLSGIASGMDTEQMVKDLMKAERIRVDKYYRQEESLKWKQEAFNTTNKTLAEFILKARSGFGLTSTSGTGTIINKSKDSFDWVKKVSSSDESVIKATGSASAMEGTYNVEVKQLAEVASVTSNKLTGIKDGGGNDISVVDAEGKFTKAGKFNITVGSNISVEITVEVGSTMANVVKQINDAKDGEASLGLRAAYDSKLGKLMITTKEQGANQVIKIENVGTDTLVDSIFGSSTVELTGKDAIIYLNQDENQPLDDKNKITQSNNNFTMFGVNYQLQSVGKTTLNVESNVDGIMDKVKEFVTEYNTLIDSLNSLIKEKNYRDYTPLTSEEKEAMTEKEIELWEAKAKSGLLRGDESINRMLQSMRSGLYENVTGVSGFSHITQIGITTGNYQSGGKLEINEDKLRAAINDNPDGVIDLLFNKADKKVQDGEDEKSTATRVRAESGLVERIFDDMISGMKDIVRKSGTGKEADLFRSVQSNMLIDFVTKQSSISVLDKDLTSIGSRITREEQLLTSRETRYWNQFTAMEKALQKMNSQSSWLSSQLG